MTTPQRTGRQRAPFTVVRVRRIKHRAPAAMSPKVRRDATQDLSALIFYGQG